MKLTLRSYLFGFSIILGVHGGLAAENITNHSDALKGALATYFQNHPEAKGAHFISPSLFEQGFGILQYDGSALSIISFSAPYGKNDFWRENPDGTISVHISSNNAEVYYSPDIFYDPIEFEGVGHFSANYTGTLVEIIINENFTLYFIDYQESDRAVSFNGTAWVEDASGNVLQVSASVLKPVGQEVKLRSEVK